MNPLLNRLARIGVTCLAAGVLGACASMADMPPGTPLSQVEAEYGAPNYSCPLPNGGQRMIWTMQPLGQYAWGTHVDSAGRTDRIEQLLTDKHFRLLDKGVWTPAMVLCEFGPPAKKEKVGLPSVEKVVWSYRYKQNSAWNSLMYVYFGKDGSHVTQVHPGPDPLYEEQFHGLFF